MKIRSITYFDSIKWPIDDRQIADAGAFIMNARSAFQDKGFEVQTTRFASSPFPLILGADSITTTVNFAVGFEKQLLASGFDYGSIGPALPEFIKSYQVIPQVLANTQNIFAAGIISSLEAGIVPKAIEQCAAVIIENSNISPDGFGNLRFAALANVPAGSPFLPAAYLEEDKEPGFAIATESADIPVTVFSSADNLETARADLISQIERKAQELEMIGQKIASRSGIKFYGIDFSFAPFPTPEQSIGTAIEKLGVPGIGRQGSLAAVALLAEALDQADFLKVGFNGVMLPVLEDVALAESVIEDSLTLNDLLLYSAVCGTGLDTIPLPGSSSKEQLFSILLDLAALAQRLGKPLTARLMPIPGMEAGKETQFDFEFFVNSKVMKLSAQPLTGLLDEKIGFRLQTRKSSNLSGQ